MHDMDWEKDNNTDQGQVAICDPPDRISTEQLETELFNAIVESSTEISADDNLDFDDIDEYFDEDSEEEDEAEQRRSTLRLLAIMRPQLAELLGAAPAE